MKQRTLGILILVVVVLIAIYSGTTPERGRSSSGSESRLLASVEADKVNRVRIEQGDQIVELRVENGSWSVPARGGYRADGSKVRSLLLKLFDLTVSQKLPASESSYDTLGLSDEAIKRGQARISFFDSADRELGGVRVGEARKGKGAGGSAPAAGQYVRSLNGKEVYLVALPLQLTVTPNYWLEQNVVNVLPAHIRSIELFSSSNGASRQEYTLKRVGESVPGTTPTFELQNVVIPEGKQLQETIVSQVRSGLENMRLSDVHPRDAADVKDLQFDMTTIYRLENGLVYTVESVEQGEKDTRYFVRLSVQFDPAVGAEVESFNKGVEEEIAKRAAEAKPSDSKADAAKAPKDEKPLPQKKPLSSEKEAEQQRAQFSGWIYELPAYQAKKLRQRFDDLVKVPENPAAPSVETEMGAEAAAQ